MVPLDFHWTGEQFVICTIPGSPKVRALAAHPQVALTIDTDTFPPHVLLGRGSASLETVEGVPPEYLEASRKWFSEEAMPSFTPRSAGCLSRWCESPSSRKGRNCWTFETRLPTPVENLIKRMGAAGG